MCENQVFFDAFCYFINRKEESFMSPHKTLNPSEKKSTQKSESKVSKDLDRLLNNGVSKETPFYDTININKHC